MKLTKFILAFLIMILAASGAEAQTSSRKQHRRIKQGVRSGELTKKETRTLTNQQKEIRQEKIAAKADGVVTRDEKKEIKQDQRKAKRTIARKKNNRRDRN
jgi:hypothetical protein